MKVVAEPPLITEEDVVCERCGLIYPTAKNDDPIHMARSHVRRTGHPVTVARMVLRQYSTPDGR